MLAKKTKPVEQSDLLSEGLARVPEVADFLGIAKTSVYALMTRGELPFTRIGGCRCIPWKSVRDLARDGMGQLAREPVGV